MFRHLTRLAALILAAVLAFSPVPSYAKPYRLDSVQPIQYNGRTFCTVFSINEEMGYFGTAGHCAFAVLSKNIDGKVTILGSPATVEMVGLSYDIAVFKADVHNVPALKLADKSVEPCNPKKVTVCETISIQGFPYGLSKLVTVVGHVAARDVPIPHPTYGIYMDSDVLDITTAGGNSGSPVFNNKGEVIGVLWGGFVDSPHSLSIPLKAVREGMAGYFQED